MGCMAFPYLPGGIYSDVKVPMSTPDDSTGLQIGSKKGEATMVNYLGLVGIGDASIEAAAKDGGITKVKTVDCQFKNILGIIQETTTIVTGE